MKILTIIPALFAMSLAFSSPAEEGDLGDGFYVGLGAAKFRSEYFSNACALDTSAEDNANNNNATMPGGSAVSAADISCNKNRNGGFLYGGYRANEHFGVELGYGFAKGFNVSEKRSISTALFPIVPVVQTEFRQESDFSTFYAAGVYRAPLGKYFAFTGKLGAHRYGYKDATKIIVTTPPVNAISPVALTTFLIPDAPPVITTITATVVVEGRQEVVSTKEKVSGIHLLYGVGLEMRYRNFAVNADYTRYKSKRDRDMNVIGLNFIYRFQ